jgi:hypothetical protein
MRPPEELRTWTNRCIGSGMLLLGATLLPVSLSAVFVVLSGDGMDSVTGYVRTMRERERLNEEQTLLHRGSEVRQSIVARLIEGRLSLWEAANALSDEEEQLPERLRLPDYHHRPHRTNEECYMHLLLLVVEEKLSGDPRRDKILTRLRTELQAYLDTHLDQPLPLAKPTPAAE